MEIWKDISGFPGYQVSNLGNVKSNKKLASKTIILKPIFVKSYREIGYYKVSLHSGPFGSCKKIPALIHRLVASAFIPNPSNKPCVNHKDNNKGNNKADNLEWVTIAENNLHAYRSGFKKSPCGEQRWSSKLTEAQAMEIKRRADNGELKKVIAKDFPVAYATVSDIIENRTWKHIKAA